jgi:DNA-binding transcriptional LysR family regulator
MDITSLQAFISVAEHSSFSLAGEHLHVTQPAVSKRIASLEDELHTRLFDRIGRQTLLTEAGRALLPRARRILAEVQDSRRAISNLSGEVGGRLSIGTSHHIGLHRLPSVLRAFNQRYAEVELDLHFMDSEEACEAVLHGDLELGIVTLPLLPSPSLACSPVWQDDLLVVVGPDHPLHGKRSIEMVALGDHPAILPAHGTFTREVIEDAFRPYAIEPQLRLSTNYLETIKMMVSIGLGWSILPESMIDEELHALEVPGLKLVRELGVARHTERTLSNAAEALISLLPLARE